MKVVTPAKAGVQCLVIGRKRRWIPAFAGMTGFHRGIDINTFPLANSLIMRNP